MAVVGAGVVGCAVALELARRGVSVSLLEAEPEPALGASGANSGILHTGFDSPAGELETELILASGPAREPLLRSLGIPVIRCGAVIRASDKRERERLAAITQAAHRNGVAVRRPDERTLLIPGEAVTDPALYTLALAVEATRHGAELRTGFALAAVDRTSLGFTAFAADGQTVRCRALVNCAGLRADVVAALAGDGSYSIYPRKGEFLVFDPLDGQPLTQILLPIPGKRTRGVLVFPTVDGKVIAGPTAVDLVDKDDWSVRPQARDEILPKAMSMYPALSEAEPIASYAGLRPAGRGVNYQIARSRVCPGLVNVAAIRSTGLTASSGIALHVAALVGGLGIRLASRRELQGGEPPRLDAPWWRRAAARKAALG
ncbi:MAG: NAD(P)/FAD-dependent oxidoreductase [Solirubrobacteraceae bacterium]